ncbi:MAG: hypothetical protein ABEH86_10330 [Haloarcula sp.]
MDFTGDERAQSVQVGAVLLFGVLIIAFSSYQAFAVPEQNQEVEFNHNQQVQTQMQDLRNAIVSVPGTSSQQAVSLQLGTRYPSRLVATNPGPPSGLLYTDGTVNESKNLTVRNAEAIDGETADYWDGTTARHYNTGAVAYKPEYNVYGEAPETVYEHSVVYNQFREGNLTLSGQTMVDGRDITLVALNGSTSHSASDSVAVDVKPTSQSSRTVRVTNATETTNVSVSFLTRLPASEWENEILDEEVDPTPESGSNGDNQYIANVTGADGPGQLYNVTIVFERGATYRLKMAKAGIGTRISTESEAYLTTVTGDTTSVERGNTEEIVLEVRDAYNNPVEGITVEGGVPGSNTGTLDRNEATTDSNGQVTFEYQTGSNTRVATNQVNFSYQGLDSSFDEETPENVSVDVDVTSGSGTGGNSEEIGLAYNNDALALDYDDDDTIPGGVEYTFTNTYDQQVEITDLGLTSQSTDVDQIADQLTPNGQRKQSEVYIDGDVGDGYTDFDSGTDLPITVDIDTDGFDNNGNPNISSSSDGIVYLYEFRPDGSNNAVDMDGKNVTQTITYTFPDGETRATAFTVTGNYSESDPDIRPPVADFESVKHNSNNKNDDIRFKFRVADKSGIDRVKLNATDKNGNELNSVTRNPSSGSLVDYSLDLEKNKPLNGNKEVNVAITLVDDSPNGNTHVCDGTITTAGTDLIDERGLRCRTS